MKRYEPEAQKASYFGHTLWDVPIFHTRYLFGVTGDSLLGHNVSKKLNTMLKQGTFLWFYLQPSTGQSIKDQLQVFKCLFEIRTEYNNIVKIDQATFPVLAPQSQLLDNPNGIAFHSNKPFRVVKAVLALSAEDTGTCQNPLARSNVLNHSAPERVSSVLLMLGRGYTSFRVMSFNRL